MYTDITLEYQTDILTTFNLTLNVSKLLHVLWGRDQ